MRNVLILDEKLGCTKLKSIINNIDDEYNIFECDDIQKAYCITMENTINLFLVEIDPDSDKSFSGFIFVQNIRKINKYSEVPVIILSDSKEYELAAFRKLHCYEYIVRPFDYKKVQKVLETALKLKSGYITDDIIKFETHGIYYPVETDNLCYIEANHRKIYIHTFLEILELSGKSLKECYKLLDDHLFYQVHKSYIISKRYIKKVNFTKRIVCMKSALGEEEIVIGVTYKDEFKKWLYKE